MGDSSWIKVRVPAEVVEEILSGNIVYLDEDHSVRWAESGDVVKESSGWVEQT